MKELIAENGRRIAAIRKAFESNDNDAITKALSGLDEHQKVLADHANASRQQEPGAGGGYKADTRAGFGAGAKPATQDLSGTHGGDAAAKRGSVAKGRQTD